MVKSRSRCREKNRVRVTRDRQQPNSTQHSGPTAALPTKPSQPSLLRVPVLPPSSPATRAQATPTGQCLPASAVPITPLGALPGLESCEGTPQAVYPHPWPPPLDASSRFPAGPAVAVSVQRPPTLLGVWPHTASCGPDWKAGGLGQHWVSASRPGPQANPTRPHWRQHLQSSNTEGWPCCAHTGPCPGPIQPPPPHRLGWESPASLSSSPQAPHVVLGIGPHANGAEDLLARLHCQVVLHVEHCLLPVRVWGLRAWGQAHRPWSSGSPGP